MKNLASKKHARWQQNHSTPYQILDHPADLKIKVWGDNLENFFQNILNAIYSTTGPETTDQETKIKIKIKAQDLENLVFNFLTELVYQMDVNNTIFSKINFSKIDETKIIAEINGKKIKKLSVEIKGITWHDFEIKKEGGDLIATLLFDA